MKRGRASRTRTAAAKDAPQRLTRRHFVTGAGLSALATAAPSRPLGDSDRVHNKSDGTPEQVHLTWGEDPSTSVCVSWASTDQAFDPRVIFQQGSVPHRTVRAVQRTYTDGLNGQTIFAYHAVLAGLEPGVLCHYSVTADNDRNRARPFSATFTTAPHGPAAFRWTSYGDLATPNTAWNLSSPQSAFAVRAVERFKPLFHLLNGDLCYANLNPAAQPEVWADFSRNIETSAAWRPWMPCPGNHEVEFCNGPQGYDAYLTRFLLPSNGSRFAGLWYRFQVGSALFVSLSADDVVYQDSGAFVSGPSALEPLPSTGNAPIVPGTSLYNRGYSGGLQTAWLEDVLRRAASDASVDWIIVQMHQDALSSSKNGNGSDLGIREQWLPLFDRYGVDLVLCGHDHDYERSWPVRGCNHGVGRDAVSGEPVDTRQPQPVATAVPASGHFDTRAGTIHFILGGGGTSAPLDAYGVNPRTGVAQAKVVTKRNRAVPAETSGAFAKPGADAVEDAIWSACRDTATGYGVAVFDLDPGVAGGSTSITINYYHALGADAVATSNYDLFDTIKIVKPRRA